MGAARLCRVSSQLASDQGFARGRQVAQSLAGGIRRRVMAVLAGLRRQALEQRGAAALIGQSTRR